MFVIVKYLKDDDFLVVDVQYNKIITMHEMTKQWFHVVKDTLWFQRCYKEHMNSAKQTMHTYLIQTG